jgi:hypothetical protein
MKRFILIDSRDPFEESDGEWLRTLAVDLKAASHSASVFLVESAVFAARKHAQGGALDALKRAGVEIRADEFALRERGVRDADTAPEVTPSPIDYIVTEMIRGASVIWR